MTTERKAGWYWVKEKALGPQWEVAEWCPDFNGWSVTANEEWVRDDDLAEIGDRIPAPDERWQCVPVEMDRAMMSKAIPNDECDFPNFGPQERKMERRWRSVLAAAPKP